MSETEQAPPKKRFVVKTHYDPSAGVHRKDVFVDDKLFPYEIDQASLLRAKQMGAQYFAQAQLDIMKHLVESLSDFLGRKVTPESLMEATRTGWI